MTAIDEKTLIEEAQRGDPKALEALLAHIEPLITKYGIRLCRDDEAAQEVLQETLIAALKHLPSFRGDASLSTWLYAVARSMCIKYRRKGKHEPGSFEPLESAHQAEEAVGSKPISRPDESLARAELARGIQNAIVALEPMYREVLILRDVEGLTAEEVAEALDLTVEAVKSRLHRARVKVRKALVPFLGDVPQPGPSCPDVVTLFSAHMEGEIESSVCQAMQEHLATCPHCQGLCDSLVKQLNICKQTSGSGHVPKEVQAAVREGVRRFLERHEALRDG